ncbi:crossover junction endodeoxyribonuclease RuvC [bacterium]|nr:crossover junction endodeoxyribonuclease RuvC [bacterium]
MRILGIDPGTATTGFGVIDVNSKGEIKLVKFGWITTSKDIDPNIRLQSIYQQTEFIIKEQKPEIMAIEKLFFYNNAKTAMRVSEAIGVIRLAAVNNALKIFEYAPLKIKSVVTQNGWAKKEEMKKTVKRLLKFRTPPKKKTHFDDAADALGVAICHALTVLKTS